MTRPSPTWYHRTADDRLELVGARGRLRRVLRRLGLRRLAARDDEDIVAWTDLHLTSERGHAVQLATPRSAVHHLDAAGLAVLVSRLDTESAAEVLAATEPRVAADVVRAAHPFVGERVLRAMPDADAATIVAAMPPSTQPAGGTGSRTLPRSWKTLHPFPAWPRRRRATPSRRQGT
jgi:hypothetical protein